MITDDFEKADILTIALIHRTNAHIFQRNDAFWHIFRGVLQQWLYHGTMYVFAMVCALTKFLVFLYEM